MKRLLILASLAAGVHAHASDQDVAWRAVNICFRDSIANMDDMTSPASDVAVAVAIDCKAPFLRYANVLHRYDPPVVGVRTDRDSPLVQRIIPLVLAHRAALRSNPRMQQ